MCQFKSAICLKDRVFVPDYDSHNKMLEELHIEDDFAHASKVFVRVELVPKDDDKTSSVDEWKLNVDQDVLPDWWDKKDCLPRIKAAVKAWCDIHILRDGTHIVRDGVWYACGSASVKAYNRTSVEAYDNACVILPKRFQTLNPILLYDEAICINHKDHTIQSPVKWEQK